MTAIFFFSKKIWIFSCVYLIGVICIGVAIASKGISNSLFDYEMNFREGGSASILILLTGVLPALTISLPLLIDRMENDMVVLRVKQKRQLFYDLFFFSIWISVCFTFLMALCGIIGAYLYTGHVHNLWGTKEGTIYYLLKNKEYFPFYISHVTSFKVWTYLLISRFLAVLFIATFVIFLKAFLKKNSYVFLVALIIVSFFLGKFRVKMVTWLSPGDLIFHLVSFMVLIFVCSILSLNLYKKKEFYH